MHPLHPIGMQGMHGMHGTPLGLHCFAMRASVQRNALGLGLRGASAPLLHCEAMQPPVRPMGCKPVQQNGLGVALQGNAQPLPL
jgi:hypothetical protein